MSLFNYIARGYNLWRVHGWRILVQKMEEKILNKYRKKDSQVVPAGYSQNAQIYASWLDFSNKDVEKSQIVHKTNPGKLDIDSLTWFLPEFKHPYYGGIYTLLRFADYFKRVKGIKHRFAILGSMDPEKVAEKIGIVFPALKDECVIRFSQYHQIEKFEPSDAGIATLWGTSYFLLRFNQTRRKFYFIQDYEPLFYPAGSTYAQVEASYRFGFYGIANTPPIKEIYEKMYGGNAEYFNPCVDTDVFYPSKTDKDSIDPLTIFFYGRPSHPRNGFELGANALRILKKRMGSHIRIVSAGDEWKPGDFGLQGVVENLGLLDYRQTAELYRKCQVGLVMMFTRHPSYLPMELMASGCLVVTNYNPATTWLLKDRINCRLADSSSTCIAEILEDALIDQVGRSKITLDAANQIGIQFSQWDKEIDKIYNYMCNPER